MVGNRHGPVRRSECLPVGDSAGTSEIRNPKTHHYRISWVPPHSNVIVDSHQSNRSVSICIAARPSLCRSQLCSSPSNQVRRPEPSISAGDAFFHTILNEDLAEAFEGSEPVTIGYIRPAHVDFSFNGTAGCRALALEHVPEPTREAAGDLYRFLRQRISKLVRFQYDSVDDDWIEFEENGFDLFVTTAISTCSRTGSASSTTSNGEPRSPNSAISSTTPKWRASVAIGTTGSPKSGTLPRSPGSPSISPKHSRSRTGLNT